jgi:selenide,water dikinase
MTSGIGAERTLDIGPPPLASLASGAGCGCKLPAQALLPIVRDLPAQGDGRLLVGAATSDDAAVFQLNDELALVQSIDFFTAPVDDPYDFGRIAAANALSDIYAMGASPLTALNVVAFPLARLGADVLGEVMRGGFDVTASAGAVLAGGHSIDDAEPKYGLAVTGSVHPQRVITNAGARPGDALVLSKPLGVGAIVAAQRRGRASLELYERAVEEMVTLNAGAARAALEAGVHAMTDVTGFGLLGHLHHVCRESGVAAELSAAAVPAIEGVQALLDGEHEPSGGARRNAAWTRAFARFEPEVPTWSRRLLVDATTSGGLLAALPRETAAQMPGSVIGRVLDGPAGTVRVRAGRLGSPSQ